MKCATLTLVLALGAAGCAVVIRAPTEADAARAGVPLLDLVEGRALFVGRCGSCHQLPDPGSRTQDAWAQVLPEMMEDAKLTPDQGAQVLGFLSALALRSGAHEDAHAQRGQSQHQ